MRSIVTVTSPSDTIDLTVLDTVKADLGITGATEDEKLSRWITQASQVAASYCNRVFAQETISEKFLPDGHWGSTHADVLNLSRLPVASITSVTPDGSAIDSSEYQYDATSGALYRLTGSNPSYWCFAQSVVVVYVAGYELLDTLPHDIERAVITMVADLRTKSARSDPELVEEEIEGISRRRWFNNVSDQSSMALPIPPMVAGMLDPYVRKWGHMR